MATDVNWNELRAVLRVEMIDGDPAGSDAARRALELILGEETLRQSVDYYLAVQPARELVRSVLWLLRPTSAMIRCRELSQLPNEIETRRSAVELLRVVADGRALPWVSEFLDDGDAQIQQWGFGVLDQLLWSELVEPEEAEAVLERAARHENEAVRGHVEFVRSYLRDRRESRV
jgi:hypothetical protein